MAPIEIYKATSLVPGATVFLHIFLSTYLSAVVARTIYRSYHALPASSGTRRREISRKGHVRTFSLLAAISLATSFFFFISFATLSYKVWATERGVELPESVFGDRGALRGGEHPGRLHIFKWLSDTPFYQDVLEIVAEKARYFWWSQQISLGMVSWGTFLAIEGQRRKIPYLWTFMALAQLVNLSYAQNLFFIAVLLTPVPLPTNARELTNASVPLTSSRYSQLIGRIFPSKPEGWLLKTPLHILLLLLTYTTVFLIPFASNTPSFMTVALLSRALLFVPLILPYVIPQSWGTIHSHPHEAYSSYKTLFGTIAAFSILLHLKSFVLAILFNTPESQYYRHSTVLKIPYKKVHRSSFDRGSAAFGKLFGAVWESSAVGAAGWDVILSGLSLGIWATVRSLDPQNMCRAIGIPISISENDAEDSTKPEESQTSKVPARKAGRPNKSDSKQKLRSKSTSDAGDADYTPSEIDDLDEGDEELEKNWEIGALAWGIITATGLGAGSTSVFSAEVFAR